jgi:hypothetical protein
MIPSLIRLSGEHMPFDIGGHLVTEEEFLELPGVYKIAPGKWGLECSSAGEKMCSAFYAKVEVFGEWNSIEYHYQSRKGFKTKSPTGEKVITYTTPKLVKGKTPDFFVPKPGIFMDTCYLSQWYKLLWVKYLDSKPELVEYLQQFEDFHDMFRGNSVNCQADVIRQYVKQGRESIMTECQPLLEFLRELQRQEQEKLKKFQQIVDDYLAK